MTDTERVELALFPRLFAVWVRACATDPVTGKLLRLLRDAEYEAYGPYRTSLTTRVTEVSDAVLADLQGVDGREAFTVLASMLAALLESERLTLVKGSAFDQAYERIALKLAVETVSPEAERLARTGLGKLMEMGYYR